MKILSLFVLALLVLFVAIPQPTHAEDSDSIMKRWFSGSSVWHASPESFEKWLGVPMPKLVDGNVFHDVRSNILKRLISFIDPIVSPFKSSQKKTMLKSELKAEVGAKAEPNYKYFRFLPPFVTSVKPDGKPVSWSARCFRNSTATLTKNNDDNYQMTLDLSDPVNWSCADFYMFATVQGLKFDRYFFHGTHTWTWTMAANTDDSERWDIETKGVRIFQFQDDDVMEVLDQVIQTALLFEPEISMSVPDWAAARNVDFMLNYARHEMKPRNITSVSIDPSLIHSGDFFGIARLDGLDPMLGWAMGSTTGHTTIALHINGVLHVCESNAKGSYWPINGIQCNEFNQWMQMARDANFQLVWAPLSPEARAKFNETAAYEYFKSMEGLDYGYYNLLWAWVDTLADNYPCMPPDFTTSCLQWEHVEIIFAFSERLIPSIGQMMWGQAFNHRIGTQNLTVSQVYKAAADKGIDSQLIPSLPEQDEWDYQTTRNGVPTQGKAMVCCVFVCNMWKAAGLFKEIDDEINCTELTNWDDYSLNIFDKNFTRPAACVAADPDNPLCQLEGKYTLVLNDYNTKQPYKHMAEKCPSKGPDYKKPIDC